ncbi:MAG: hypothetical protein QXW23_03860 [Thermofilaceae archaeon]
MRRSPLLAVLAFLAFSPAVLSEPQSFTYKVYLDFGSRRIGFVTCEAPSYDDVGVEIRFTLLRLPHSAALHLHFYSVDRCAAYFTVTINDFFVADFVNLGKVKPCSQLDEGRVCDTYLVVNISTRYLRIGVNNLRVTLHRRCSEAWLYKCGARHFFLYNDSYLELMYRAVNVSFSCVPSVCSRVTAVYELPTGERQRVEIPVPGSLLVPEGSSLNFTVEEVIHANGTMWVYRKLERKIDGQNISLVAFFDTYHYVDVSSLFGEVSGRGWYKEGELAVVSIVPTVLELHNWTRLVFTGWSGSIKSESPTLTFRVQSPVKLVANWVREYYILVEKPASECSGWYREGSTFSCHFPASIVHGNGTRDVLVEVRADSGMLGEGIVIRGPMKITPVYKRMYKLSVVVIKHIELTLHRFTLRIPLKPEVAKEEWIDAGSTFEVLAPSVPLYRFEKWTIGATAETLTVTVDRPYTLSASYVLTVPLEPLFAITGLLLLAKIMPTIKKLARRKETARVVSTPDVGKDEKRKIVEEVSRNIEGLVNALENVKSISSEDVLELLEKHVVGPLKHLEEIFGYLPELKKIIGDVELCKVNLEEGVYKQKVLKEDEVRKLCKLARLWAVRVRNLHFEK